eukprot:821906-Pyramimonas_sp.AAC.1
MPPSPRLDLPRTSGQRVTLPWYELLCNDLKFTFVGSWGLVSSRTRSPSGSGTTLLTTCSGARGVRYHVRSHCAKAQGGGAQHEAEEEP